MCLTCTQAPRSLYRTPQRSRVRRLRACALPQYSVHRSPRPNDPLQREEHHAFLARAAQHSTAGRTAPCCGHTTHREGGDGGDGDVGRLGGAQVAVVQHAGNDLQGQGGQTGRRIAFVGLLPTACVWLIHAAARSPPAQARRAVQKTASPWRCHATRAAAATRRGRGAAPLHSAAPVRATRRTVALGEVKGTM